MTYDMAEITSLVEASELRTCPCIIYTGRIGDDMELICLLDELLRNSTSTI